MVGAVGHPAVGTADDSRPSHWSDNGTEGLSEGLLDGSPLACCKPKRGEPISLVAIDDVPVRQHRVMTEAMKDVYKITTPRPAQFSN